MEVRGQDGGEPGHEPDSLQGIGCPHRSADAGKDDGVVDDFPCKAAQGSSDGLGDGAGTDHANLDMGHAEVGQDSRYLPVDQVRRHRMAGLNPQGVLDGQAGDGSATIDPKHSHGLEIGLNASPAGGVGAGNGQDRLGEAGHVPVAAVIDWTVTR